MATDFTSGFSGTKSYFADLRERPVAAGSVITEEGQCLRYTSDGAGGLAVMLCDGTAADYAGSEQDGHIAGFAITDSLSILSLVQLETFTVPAAVPYDVQLKKINVVGGGTAGIEANAYDNTGAAALTAVAAAPGAGDFAVTTAGLASFNAAEAGSSVTLAYRYSLTAAEVMETYHSRSVNNQAQGFFSSVSVGGQEGEIFTSQYDATQRYALLDKIYSGAGGKLTNAAGGALVGIVSAEPSTDSAFLGVKFSKLQ